MSVSLSQKNKIDMIKKSQKYHNYVFWG